MMLLARFLGFGIPSWLVYALAALAFIGAVYAKGRIDQAHKNEIAQLEATIAQVKADLAANEAITRQAQEDADRAEAEAEKQKELLDELRNEKSCPLTDSQIDGINKIDGVSKKRPAQ